MALSVFTTLSCSYLTLLLAPSAHFWDIHINNLGEKVSYSYEEPSDGLINVHLGPVILTKFLKIAMLHVVLD
jgi:hypothetical protein